MDKLLQCPFCGGEAKWARPNYLFGHIKCTQCPISTISMPQPEAIKAWNTRQLQEISKEEDWSNMTKHFDAFLRVYYNAPLKNISF